MFRLTHILPDGTVHPHEPVASIREVLFTVADLLVGADVVPRVARRFALHLSRQPLGTQIEQEPTGWRFRIDQVEEKAADEADATPCST